jgi:hypothetical protein
VPGSALTFALCGVLALSPVCAATYVQGALGQAHDAKRDISITMPSTQIAGDLNVVFVAWRDTQRHVISVTDTHHNLYVRAGELARATEAQVAYYAMGIAQAVRGSNTVIVQFDAPVSIADVRIAEYHGIDAEHPLDGLANSDASAPARSESLKTLNADDLLIAGAFGGTARGPGPGYTQRLMDSEGLLEDATVSVRERFRASILAQTDNDFLIQLIAFRAPRSQPLAEPYPHSTALPHLRWDLSTVLSHRRGIGSDIWPTTWAADGNLYAAFGDGGGFDGTERSKATGRVSLGFARI